MNAAVPGLDQLHELPWPAAPMWVPGTWGWLLIVGLLALALLARIVARLCRWWRDRYRREALVCLDALERRLRVDPADCAALRELPELLKRVALTIAPRTEVARLGSHCWQGFLQAHSPGPMPADFAHVLAMLAYAPEEAVRRLDGQALCATARRWLETHHVAP